VASRANEERRTRLQEIVRELAAIAKDQRPEAAGILHPRRAGRRRGPA